MCGSRGSGLDTVADKSILKSGGYTRDFAVSDEIFGGINISNIRGVLTISERIYLRGSNDALHYFAEIL